MFQENSVSAGSIGYTTTAYFYQMSEDSGVQGTKNSGRRQREKCQVGETVT
jgi:hypothetical protein